MISDYFSLAFWTRKQKKYRTRSQPSRFSGQSLCAYVDHTTTTYAGTPAVSPITRSDGLSLSFYVKNPAFLTAFWTRKDTENGQRKSRASLTSSLGLIFRSLQGLLVVAVKRPPPSPDKRPRNSSWSAGSARRSLW